MLCCAGHALFPEEEHCPNRVVGRVQSKTKNGGIYYALCASHMLRFQAYAKKQEKTGAKEG